MFLAFRSNHQFTGNREKTEKCEMTAQEHNQENPN